MKNKLPLLFFAALVLSLVCESALAKKMTPKRGSWLDLQTNGILFGTIAEASRDEARDKANVTYYIRRKDGKGRPEKLVSVKGLFAFTLEPGRYEIYEWSISRSKKHESQDRYEFEIRAGYLTYIGRIVTDVFFAENPEGKKLLKNYPYVTDHRNFDATLFTEVYPTLARLGVILAAKDKFAWR